MALVRAQPRQAASMKARIRSRAAESGTGANAQVENVVAVSEDGARVYFVAQGVLADNLGVGDVGNHRRPLGRIPLEVLH